MTRRRNRIASKLILAGVLACAFAARGGEKVEIKGSTSIELPKPNRKIEEERRFKFDDSASELSGGYVPPQSIGATGPLDRKLREMLDKKKNWIFMNPYERKFDDRTSEILGEEKRSSGSGSPLMEHRLLQDEDKSAMQKFLEERGARRSNDSALSEGREREQGDLSQPSNRMEQADDEDKLGDRGDRKEAAFVNERGAPEMKAPSFDTAEFQKRMERTPLEGSFFGPSRVQRPEIDTKDLKQQQEARDAEFEKFIQPRGLSSAAGGLGRLDPLNTAADSTRQEANPAAARRTDQFLSSPNRVNFGDGRSSGISASLPGSTFDFGSSARAAQSSPFLPSAAPAAAQAPSVAPAPFVFEFPRRKF